MRGVVERWTASGVRPQASGVGPQALRRCSFLKRKVKIPILSHKTRQGWGTLVFPELLYWFVPSHDAFFAAAFVGEQEAALGAEELLWGNF